MASGTRYRVLQNDRVRNGGRYSPPAEQNRAYNYPYSPQKAVDPPPLLKCDGKPNAWLDRYNIALLLLLYVLQGIPMGLSSSIPLILSSRVTFQQQALFSLVAFPFSFKLLWAPIVDSLYLPKIGRRKSWLIPTQLLCGIFMICGTTSLDKWVGETGEPPYMPTLTIYFFILYLLMATQDIALDGWALTVLQRRNICYASTCNTVGQTIGYYIANVGFLTFHSADISNKYLRWWSGPQVYGIVTLGSFSLFWGVVFLISTIYLWAYKVEKHDESEDDIVGVWDAYQQLLHCVKLQRVQSLCLVLLTNRLGVAIEAATMLKLVQFGMPESFPAVLSPLLVLSGTLIPIVVSRFLASWSAMGVYIQGFKIRLVTLWLYVPILLATRRVFGNDDGWPGWTYLLFLCFSVFLSQIGSNCQFVAMTTFFSRISDPSIGGTYMTLFNTCSNLGIKWTSSLSLFLMDTMTINKRIATEREKACQLAQWVADPVSCGESLLLDKLCNFMAVECHISLDGYYLQLVICTLIGVAWIKCFKHIVYNLEGAPLEDWHIYHHDANCGSENSSEGGKMVKVV